MYRFIWYTSVLFKWCGVYDAPSLAARVLLVLVLNRPPMIGSISYKCDDASKASPSPLSSKASRWGISKVLHRWSYQCGGCRYCCRNVDKWGRNCHALHNAFVFKWTRFDRTRWPMLVCDWPMHIHRCLPYTNYRYDDPCNFELQIWQCIIGCICQERVQKLVSGELPMSIISRVDTLHSTLSIIRITGTWASS